MRQRYSPVHAIRWSVLFCALLLCPLVHSQAGSLDSGFGINGMVIAPVTVPGEILDVVVQADRKTVAVGKEGQGITTGERWFIVRYDENGVLDPSFAGTGVLHPFPMIPGRAVEVALDSQGRILVVGEIYNGSNLDCVTVRVSPIDGFLDETFGTDGVVITEFPRKGSPSARNDRGSAIAVQADGRVVVAAMINNPRNSRYYLALARYNSDGSLDTDPVTGFGEPDGGARTGWITDPALEEPVAGMALHISLALQPDGKAVVSAGYIGGGTWGEGWILSRYLADGALDTTFGIGGRVVGVTGWSTVYLWDVAIQGTRILAVGRGYESAVGGSLVFLIAGYHLSDGSLDTSFGLAGLARTGMTTGHQATDIAVYPDGRFVACGGYSTGPPDPGAIITFRFGPDGLPDASFGTGGRSELVDAQNVRAVALDPVTGDPVLAGSVTDPSGTQPLIARFLGGGQPVPVAPSQLVATAVSASQVNLSWSDESSDEDGFEVERSLDGTNWTLVGTLASDATAYTDGSVGAGITYFYAVRAFNSVGPSGYSNTATATTPPAAPPVAPSGLSATSVSSSQIDLLWTDNAMSEDGFDVEWSLDGLAWSVLATLSPDIQSYSDTGLLPSTTYHYRISAFNAAGSSAPSNVATATTGAAPPGVTVSSITPDTMDVGTSMTVTITGTGFQPGASVSFENGSGPTPSVSGVSFVSTTQITATISVSNGGPKVERIWDVRVTNADLSTDSLPGEFTVIK